MTENRMRNPTRATAWSLTGGTCFYCGVSLFADEHVDATIALYPGGISSELLEELRAKELCLDHATPKSRGGASSGVNYVPSCRSCNIEKGARDIEEYRVWLMLNVGRPPVSFFGEGAPIARDWLVVASPDRRRGGTHLHAFCGARGAGA